ncbi:hypothetical protein [Ornithinibacillus halotolerans]|uniref:Uncharacterized protein n=1 Tax=Ornithinibacillus halotolerans TaxID=1274357 RepID=A0A916S6A6_9BACI|nr:hypothetical protein [Ornithinibacillus halotolerans]GGA86283.1 hypothetical protein GCM10008025_31550 [Ornithinibacillus halotolerans]
MQIRWLKRSLEVLVIIVLLISFYFLLKRSQYNPTESLEHSALFAELNLKFIQTQVILFILLIIRFFVKKRYLELLEKENGENVK